MLAPEKQFWSRPEQQDIYIALLWGKLGLPGTPNVAAVLGLGTWRLVIDAYGAAVFQRSIKREQGKKVQRSDMMQMAYLAGVQRRVLVTADKDYSRIATEVLRQRHLLARAILLT